MSAEDPREHAARIEQLLAELRASLGPTAWPRVEELVSRLVAVYGAALGRTLLIVEEAGALAGELPARLAADELVGALLALHAIHPQPVLDRARRAVERVRTLLGAGAGQVELELDERHRLALRLTGEWRTSVPRSGVAEALRRALEEAAPELDAIEIGGADWSAPDELVQLDLSRARSPAAP